MYRTHSQGDFDGLASSDDSEEVDAAAEAALLQTTDEEEDGDEQLEHEVAERRQNQRNQNREEEQAEALTLVNHNKDSRPTPPGDVGTIDVAPEMQERTLVVEEDGTVARARQDDAAVSASSSFTPTATDRSPARANARLRATAVDDVASAAASSITMTPPLPATTEALNNEMSLPQELPRGNKPLKRRKKKLKAQISFDV